MARLRILHLTDRLGGRGGAYSWLRSVLDHQARRDDVHVAAGDGGGAPGITVHVLPGLEARERSPTRLRELLDALRPDAIHVHTVMNPDALELAAQAGAILTAQDHRAFCPGQGKLTRHGAVCTESLRPDLCAGCFDDPVYAAAIHALTEARLAAVRAMRAVTVLSAYMGRELAAAGVPRGRIHVIPPFVHGLDPAAAPDGPPCILFVGRLTHAKGVRDAIAAWRLAGLDLPLVFAGTGPLRTALEAEGFPVLGWLDRDRLARAYRRARAVLFPPRWQEPFGIVGLEALTLGVPVAAWESGGTVEWHGPEGLGPWGDVPALARRLRDVAGTAVTPPNGFARETLLARLRAITVDSDAPRT